MSLPPERLQLLYDVARAVTTVTELDPLLRLRRNGHGSCSRRRGAPCCCSTRSDGGCSSRWPVRRPAETRRLEYSTRSAFQRTSESRAGFSIRTGPRWSEDAANDSRFYSGIDQATGITTRAILCARTRIGNIGVVEVINPMRDRFAADLAFFEAIAVDLAVACEKARLYDRLRRETLGLRQVCRVAGLALIAVDLVCGVGALYAHVAWALPLGELPTRPAMLAAVLPLVAGVALVGIARGWLVETTPGAAPL